MGRKGGGRQGKERERKARVREGHPVLSVQFVGNPTKWRQEACGLCSTRRNRAINNQLSK